MLRQDESGSRWIREAGSDYTYSYYFCIYCKQFLAGSEGDEGAFHLKWFLYIHIPVFILIPIRLRMDVSNWVFPILLSSLSLK